MPEGEPQNSDDIFKEILGFDPESGGRIEDRGSLQQIQETKLAIPHEVQSAFIESSKVKDAIRFYPEKLFVVRETEGIAPLHRDYYSWYQSSAANLDFLKTTEAAFKYKNGRFEISYVALIGERHSGQIGDLDSNSLLFNSGVLCIFYLSQRGFWIEFDDKGYLEEISFMQKRSVGIDVPEMISQKDQLNRLLELGKLATTTENKAIMIKSKHQLKVKGEQITLKRFEDDTLRDDLQIPQQISKEVVIQKLFNPLTLEDPINAPPELDDSWRFANLMDVVGVKWERY